ncbi:GA12899PAlike, partial [Caligus rogercresseyi]
PEYQNYSSHHHHDETLNSLRQRLNTMRAIFGDGDESLDSATASARKRAARRQQSNCLDTIIDGSFMGMVLTVCLAMVLGAAFFAYKNLYYAVMKKMSPERSEL